eukprot:4908535-Pleurochrysis_carterae.AAC.5
MTVPRANQARSMFLPHRNFHSGAPCVRVHSIKPALPQHVREEWLQRRPACASSASAACASSASAACAAACAPAESREASTGGSASSAPDSRRRRSHFGSFSEGHASNARTRGLRPYTNACAPRHTERAPQLSRCVQRVTCA